MGSPLIKHSKIEWRWSRLVYVNECAILPEFRVAKVEIGVHDSGQWEIAVSLAVSPPRALPSIDFCRLVIFAMELAMPVPQLVRAINNGWFVVSAM
jgi:hypothetical protein